jgi:hypothetical protein
MFTDALSSSSVSSISISTQVALEKEIKVFRFSREGSEQMLESKRLDKLDGPTLLQGNLPDNT